MREAEVMIGSAASPATSVRKNVNAKIADDAIHSAADNQARRAEGRPVEARLDLVACVIMGPVSFNTSRLSLQEFRYSTMNEMQ
jgi:hypothetical protein